MSGSCDDMIVLVQWWVLVTGSCDDTVDDSVFVVLVQWWVFVTGSKWWL